MKSDRRFILSVAGPALIAALAFGSPPLYEVSSAGYGHSRAGSDVGISPDAFLQEIAFDASDVLHADEAFAVSGVTVPVTPETAEMTYVGMQPRELFKIGAAESVDGTFPLRTMPSGKPGRIVGGWFIAKDFVHEGSEVNCVMQVVPDETDEKMIHIHNFYGLEETVDVVVDVAAGTVSVLPQLIWKSATYGNVYMFPIVYEGDKVKFYPSSPVTGTIDAEGVIRLGQWGAIVGEGAYAGTLLAAVDMGEYIPSNATMTALKRVDGADTEISYPLLLQQYAPSEITVYNFGTTGVPVKARVNSDGKISVSPQFIANMGLYGAFNCFPIDLSTMIISKTDPIMGTVSGNTIAFDPWVAGSVMQDGLVALFLTRSELTALENIDLPPAYSFGLEGEGTESSPWLVSSAGDLMSLAQASRTNSFSGKYFRQTADIDMTAARGFEPIGSAACAFNGSYDGGGHRISNLHIDGIGYHFQGLFGALYTESSVSGLNMTGCSVTGSGYYLGILAGYSQGRIENCSVEGKAVTSGVCVGGVIGRSYGCLQGCSFSGFVSGSGYVGGVAGYSYGEISRCSSDAEVSLPVRITDGAACVGGIAGLAQSYSTAREGKIYDCRFSGSVTQGSGYGFAGGIAGYMYAVEVDRCLNSGLVRATAASGDSEQTGGIAGIIRDMTMRDCLNAGQVSVAGPSEGVGGLIGYITCSYTGGAGLSEFVRVSRCYNSGQINGPSVSGHAGVFGAEYTLDNFDEKPSDTAFENVYSDNQATGLDDEVFGRPTSYFIDALPDGFEASCWKVNGGLYTTLKYFEGTTDDLIASAVIRFDEGESTRVMKHGAAVSAPSGVRWYLCAEDGVSDISGSVQMLGDVLHMRGVYGNEEVVATVGGKTTGRRYMINVVPKVFDGEGTAENPYLIKSAADFIRLHDAVMHYDHRGDFFLQTDDIDFQYSDDFSGVAAGNHVRRFAGVFDGGGWRIEKLKIKSRLTGEDGDILQGTWNYGGLFHIGSVSSTIRNVIIGEDCTFDFYGQAGAIIGYTEGVVENCRNYARVSGVSHVGGITGYATETAFIRDCYNAGDIGASGDYAGGIVGYCLGSVISSQNDADVIGAGRFVGGVAGASGGCVRYGVNSGVVEGASYVGGVIGSCSDGYGKGDVIGCFSSGMVICDSDYRGGVVGFSNGRGDVESNFFDSAVNNMDGCSTMSRGFTGMATSEYLADTPPEGFDKEEYAFSSSAYPSLARFAEEYVGKARRSIFLRFEKGEKLGNVLRAIPLSSDEEITWSLAENKYFSLSDGMLLVDIPESEVAADVLTANYAGGISKTYGIRSVPVILEGRGSPSEPFLIRTPEDLNLLADFMETSKTDYEGYCFRVENDIAYTSEVPFKPIARSGVQFQGDFDGNSKTISGIDFLDENTKTGKNIGFFGTVGLRGNVRDLTLDGAFQANSYVGSFAGQLYGKISGCVSRCGINAKGGYVGGFAGRMYDGSAIDNCSFAGVIMDRYSTNVSYIGGFAGQTDAGSLISNCVNSGKAGNVEASGTAFTGSQYVGGIAGWHNGGIRDCVNDGEVRGRMHVAGIAGRLGKTGEIRGSVNRSDISVISGGYVAGIAAVTQGGGPSVIESCYNSGAVHGKSYVAGIIGQITNGCTVDNCHNTGRISGFGSTAYGVGGVIGQMSESAAWPVRVTNSWNEGEVYNEAQSTGGFLGKGSGGYISDCWNTGDVTVVKEDEDMTSSGVGGFAGSFCATAERIWNSGDVVSDIPCAAGIIGTGAMPVTEISQAVNFGDVTLSRVVVDKGFGAGGIWGGYGPVSLKECYNFGTITAPDLVAGINGAMWTNSRGGSSVVNCYNAGRVTASDDRPVAAGNIATLSSAAVENRDLISVHHAYFDTDICVSFADDEYGEGLSRSELMKADLGDAFTYRPACLPTLPFMDEIPLACFHAAHYELAEGETPDDVRTPFLIGLMPHVTWSSSDNIEISESGIVSALVDGTGWIRAMAESSGTLLEKTFDVNISHSGVDGIVDEGCQIVRVEYYTLDGFSVKSPGKGTHVIRKVTYADGSCEVAKVRL